MGGRSKRKCVGGSVNGFHEGEAAAAFGAVADGLRIVGDGGGGVFGGGLMAADVGYGGRGESVAGIAGWQGDDIGRSESRAGAARTAAAGSGAVSGGFGVVVKDEGELYVGFSGGGDEGVGFFCGNVHGFFGEDVKAALGGGDALLGVKGGGSAEDDEVERLVCEEGSEV